jgi:hypothetical protein
MGNQNSTNFTWPVENLAAVIDGHRPVYSRLFSVGNTGRFKFSLFLDSSDCDVHDCLVGVELWEMCGVLANDLQVKFWFYTDSNSGGKYAGQTGTYSLFYVKKWLF